MRKGSTFKINVAENAKPLTLPAPTAGTNRYTKACRLVAQNDSGRLVPRHYLIMRVYPNKVMVSTPNGKTVKTVERSQIHLPSVRPVEYATA